MLVCPLHGPRPTGRPNVVPAPGPCPSGQGGRHGGRCSLCGQDCGSVACAVLHQCPCCGLPLVGSLHAQEYVPYCRQCGELTDAGQFVDLEEATSLRTLVSSVHQNPDPACAADLAAREMLGSTLASLIEWDSPDAGLGGEGTLRHGEQHLRLRYENFGGDAEDHQFQALVACPVQDCPGPCWASVHQPSELIRVLDQTVPQWLISCDQRHR